MSDAEARKAKAEARRAEKEEAQLREFRGALGAAEAGEPLIEPTAEEARNGWDSASLTAYVHEQRAAQEMKVDPRSLYRKSLRGRPRVANKGKYRPLRWRG